MRLFCLALAISVIDADFASPQDLVLTNAQIADPVARTVARGAIWIRDGRIAGRGPAAPSDAPGDRIDLNGQWIIPGLVDLHTHSFGNAAPRGVFDAGGTESTAVRVPRAGVTAFLDLFGAEDYLLQLRDRQRAGEVGGAAIFAAGPCFTATKGHCSEYGIPTRLIDSPDAARKQLAELAPKRPDVVKVVYDHFDYGPTSMPTVDRATLEALLSAAKTHGLKTIVHVGTWEDVRHAVAAGATAITHVPRDGVVPADVVALMAQHRTHHIPTLVVQGDLAEMYDRPQLLASPLLVAVTSDAIRAAYSRGLDSVPARTRSWVARMRTQRDTVIESVRRLHAGGVRMLTGTDAGNWGVFQGYSVHREMVRLVEAGLTPWDALAAATTRAGEFLGQKYGVQPGDVANLVVLNASPIESIENTQRIAMVVLRGKVAYDASGRWSNRASADSTCPYTACALRVSKLRVIAGAPGNVVARLGAFSVSANLVELFARSDSATAHARRFARAYNRTKWMAMMSSGAIGLTAGLATSRAMSDHAVSRPLIYWLVGATALNMYAHVRLDDARDHLSMAVWWYNRSLADRPR